MKSYLFVIITFCLVLGLLNVIVTFYAAAAFCKRSSDATRTHNNYMIIINNLIYKKMFFHIFKFWWEIISINQLLNFLYVGSSNFRSSSYQNYIQILSLKLLIGFLRYKRMLDRAHFEARKENAFLHPTQAEVHNFHFFNIFINCSGWNIH